MMDKIIVVSNHSKNVFEDTTYVLQNEKQQRVDFKCNTEIDVVNYPVKKYDPVNLELDLPYDFNFFSVAQWGPRKNLPNTVKYFVEEFHDEEVGLVLKTNLAKNCIMDRTLMLQRLSEELLTHYPNKKCKIYLLHGDMTEQEMHSLYLHPKIKAGLFLPHGEGFGLPIFEAAYSGLPVVATGWSGHLDFLIDENGKNHFYNVAFDLNKIPENAVWEGVLIKESMWSYPRETSAKENMRKCYNDIVSGKSDIDMSKYFLIL